MLLEQFLRVNACIYQLLDRCDNCRFVFLISNSKPFILCLKHTDSSFSTVDALVDHCRKKILRLQISLFHVRKELRESFFQFLYEGCRETEHVHGDMLIF